MKRLAVWSAYAGVAAFEVALASAYQSRGTWWHYLLHQLIGWGLGLSVAAGVMLVRRSAFVPPVGAAVAGQLVSIGPDLMFRYLRMPHTMTMDAFVGHVSIHRGPSPVLVALAVLVLGAQGWTAAAHGRRRTAFVLAVAGPLVLLVACLLAVPLPTRLADV